MLPPVDPAPIDVAVDLEFPWSSWGAGVGVGVGVAIGVGVAAGVCVGVRVGVGVGVEELRLKV